MIWFHWLRTRIQLFYLDLVTREIRKQIERRVPQPEIIDVEGIRLINVHDPASCAGRPCVIHAPTEHHMRAWKLHWRDDRSIFERLCAHGIGHPDPDQYAFWESINRESLKVHGCDGCCVLEGSWAL